ncbi:hypothetical protein D1AOALGA4SA_1722 [Olavius algarvensis Delta 1 endosymbiont]|nr:hypothetical protein D1AOALGA4SA_1722 [Olavius algarvensis Delta 1 endosymbiont]
MYIDDYIFEVFYLFYFPAKVFTFNDASVFFRKVQCPDMAIFRAD